MVEVNGRQLASILKANRANLVRQNMIDDGNTKQEAEASIDVILSIAEYFGGAKIELGSDDGRMRAKLELDVNLGE